MTIYPSSDGSPYHAPLRQQFNRVSALVDKAVAPIVTLCGSTRFKQLFIRSNYEFTRAGFIVLSVGWFVHDLDVRKMPTPEEKIGLDHLHKQKIRLSDLVFVIDPEIDGKPYIGMSTQSEIDYATRQGVPVHFLSSHEFPFITLGA